MIKQRFGVMFLATLLTLSLIAGCGKQSATPSGGGTVTISFMTFSGSGDNEVHLQAIITEFEAQNTGIKVQVIPASWDDYWTKLQTAIAGGTAPDTFELNYENFVPYARKGVLLDLTAMAAADNLEKVFYPRAYQVFNHEGKQYGLVETFSTVLLFYNKDLFDQKNVAYPTASWTWQDEIEAAKKLTDEGAGVWGSLKPVQFWEFYKVIAQNGGKIMDGDQVVIDSPENVEALQYMVDRIHLHKIQPTDAQMSGMNNEDLFKAGKVAMLHTGIWQFDFFKDAPFQWEVALEPHKTQKAHHFFANAVSISKDTKHAEAAYKWAKFLTSSPEAAKVRIDASWELPAVADPKLVEGYLEKSPPATRQAVFDALNSPVVPPVIENWDEMTDQVGKELEQAKLGTITPAQALANARTKLEALTR